MSPGELEVADAARKILRALERGHSVVSITRVGDTGGRILFVQQETELRRLGSSGDGTLDRTLERQARELLAGGRSEGRADSPSPGHYLEVHHPRPTLVIVGAGHIAIPLSEVGEVLGFQVVVADDRPDFATRDRFPAAARVERMDFSDPFAGIPLGPLSHVVLVTRGHKYDYECLRHLLRTPRPVRYIGMIGSRRRVRATFQQLLDEGVPRDRIAQVRAPLGLDLGAETPGEIAVAVAAELVLEWRGGTGTPLHRSERVLERYFPEDGAGSGSEAP